MSKHVFLSSSIAAREYWWPRQKLGFLLSIYLLHKLWHPGILAARKWRENEKMKRKWRENEKMEKKWREIHSLHFLTFFYFAPSLSISYIKNCLILLQNVKYSTFVANVTKNLTYAL